MPLKLHPPREGKSPNWSIRGTYLGVYIDRTSGTPVEALAKQKLTAAKREIERGDLAGPLDPQGSQERTFEDAALAYIKGGGDAQYLGRYDAARGIWTGGVIPHFLGTPLSHINQVAIDQAAVSLYPTASAMTRNRQVYTPVSAVLKHAGLNFKIRRPKGWRGKSKLDWMVPPQAFRVIDAAFDEDEEFGVFLTFLLYTGCRLNEGLSLTCDRVTLGDSFAYLPQTKNDDPRSVHLPPIVVAGLANHPRGMDRGKQKVFRFRKCGRLYTLMNRVKAKAGPDVDFVTFHIFRHTWATWMRRYGKLDTRGLLATGAWKDHVSASRYEHVIVSEEAMKADLLPVPQRSRNARVVENPGNRRKLASEG